MTDKKSVPASEESKSHWCKLVSKTTRYAGATVSQDSFSIGRAPSNNFQIKDSKISSSHCVFLRSKKTGSSDDYEYFIEDKSTNGTYLNGEKIGKGLKKQLKNGDEIMLLKPGQVTDEG